MEDKKWPDDYVVYGLNGNAQPGDLMIAARMVSTLASGVCWEYAVLVAWRPAAPCRAPPKLWTPSPVEAPPPPIQWRHTYTLRDGRCLEVEQKTRGI